MEEGVWGARERMGGTKAGAVRQGGKLLGRETMSEKDREPRR